MLHAVVLAGGRSSRMGQDKAGILFRGQSLLQHCTTLLVDLGADAIYISGRAGDFTCVPDLYPHSGPPGGLLSTLYHIRTEGVLDGSPLLVIPVDMPLLTVAVLEPLLESLGQAQAIRYRGEVFPCVFRASEELYSYLQKLFAEDSSPGGQRSMKALLAFCQAKELVVPEEFSPRLVNVNTPDQLNSLSTER